MSDQFPPSPGTPENSGTPENPYGAPNPYGSPDQYGVPAPGGYGLPVHQAPAYAAWIKRVAAYLIDQLLTSIVSLPASIGYVMYSIRAADSAEVDPTTGMTTITATPTGLEIGLMVVGGLIGLAFTIWNVLIRQGKTGQTIGKSALGITLISEQSGHPIGAGMCFVRQLAHIFDSLVCYLGWLWPLWDAKRQTFADKIMNTVVVEKR